MQLTLSAHVPSSRLSIPAARFTLGAGMGYGRLVRVNKPPGSAVAYIVALPEPAEAVKLIENKVAEHGDTVEDRGRVSDALLTAMKLQHGDFTRA